MRKLTTESQKNKIKELALKGVTDKEISEITGVNYNQVAIYTRLAWEEKFNN